MDRRHLEYFLAVAEAGSFTRAAARLTIAQPSLSHAVRLLERELGADLFERGGRGVRLTPAGEALVAPARRTLRSFTLAAGAVRGASDTGYGRVRVMTNTLWAMDPLVRVVGAFRQVRPGARIVVVDPVHRSDVLEAVRSGEADLGLVGGTPPAGPLASQWLGDQDLVAVVPRARSGLPSPLGGGRPGAARAGDHPDRDRPARARSTSCSPRPGCPRRRRWRPPTSPRSSRWWRPGRARRCCRWVWPPG